MITIITSTYELSTQVMLECHRRDIVHVSKDKRIDWTANVIQNKSYNAFETQKQSNTRHINSNSERLELKN